MPGGGDGDSTDGDWAETFLRPPCPVIVVDVDRCYGMACVTKREARRISRRGAREEEPQEVPAVLDSRGREVIGLGKHEIVIGRRAYVERGPRPHPHVVGQRPNYGCFSKTWTVL